MNAFLETMAIWRNPIFMRYCRSRLRFKNSIVWILIALIFATFSVTLSYILATNSGVPPEEAARREWIGLIVLQGLILMVKGTGATSAALIQDRIDQTLDYQRLTPLSPLQCLVGYLFGLPVLEYVMFALTLPHLIFIVSVGNIPLGVVFSVYFSFFVCVAMYHMTAIAVGIVMNRWVLGFLLSIFMVVVINVVLPLFISQFGLKFVQFLSVWPVISQKVVPIVFSPEALQFTNGNPFLSAVAMGSNVPVYNWMVTPFQFTLLLQGSLIVTFFLMAYRRWQSDTRHSLSKPYAMCFLAGFIALVIGNVWPAITGQFLPFQVFGQNDLEQLKEVIAVAFPGIYGFAGWALTGVLLAIVVPTHHSCVRGLRRAAKLGRRSPRLWDDDSGNIAFMALFVAIVMVGFLVLYATITSAGYFDFRVDAEYGLWRLPTVLALVLFYTLLLIQVLELKPTVIVILMLWSVPILVAAVASASAQGVNTLHVVIASLSPIGLLVLASAIPLIGAVPINDFDPGIVVFGCYSGLAFVTAQIVFLLWRWRMLSARFRKAATVSRLLASDT